MHMTNGASFNLTNKKFQQNGGNNSNIDNTSTGDNISNYNG